LYSHLQAEFALRASALNPVDIKHYASCSSNYPERNSDEEQVQMQHILDGYYMLFCIDCGANVNNLPDPGDYYWEEIDKEAVYSGE
jgi:hypothetical protein